MIGQKVAPQHPQQTNQTKWTNFEMQQRQGARPALQALPPTGDLAIPRNGPHPTGRRLSN
jgi:DNA/RNA endonuclease G (NUC1)